ncbi:hypothetical protein DFA_03560 [Cavenderia fasciculata]|uniref:Uncharacterized protein n=1 Tax=Cavenderia fasciculata TaxID=261658 RepID=F4PHX7_CACFS|nr:uncharacterized protein DFA_03560 [Cavenderia fasciculata]EGG25311.1 hypothetical protein DFA_03560 [Cavenderia fasciculata]|eukprot:XP_004363162.1 hypothetical protein DFA_03560 [Cavenderia fasciculata]
MALSPCMLTAVSMICPAIFYSTFPGNVLVNGQQAYKTIQFNIATDCSSSAGCDFNDGSNWIGGVSPNNGDYIYIASINFTNARPSTPKQTIYSYKSLTLAAISIVGSESVQVEFNTFSGCDVAGEAYLGKSATWNVVGSSDIGAAAVLLDDESSLLLQGDCNFFANSAFFGSGSVYRQESYGSFETQTGPSIFSGSLFIQNQTTVYLYGQNTIGGSFFIDGDTTLDSALITTQAYFEDLQVNVAVVVAAYSALFVTFDFQAPNVTIFTQGQISVNPHLLSTPDGSPIIVSVGSLTAQEYTYAWFGTADTITLGQVNSSGTVEFSGASTIQFTGEPSWIQIFNVDTVNNADGSILNLNLNNTNIAYILAYTSSSANTYVKFNYQGSNQLGSIVSSPLYNTLISVLPNATLDLTDSIIESDENSYFAVEKNALLLIDNSTINTPSILADTNATVQVFDSTLITSIGISYGSSLLLQDTNINYDVNATLSSSVNATGTVVIGGHLYLENDCNLNVLIQDLSSQPSAPVQVQGGAYFSETSQLVVTFANAKRDLKLNQYYNILSSNEPISMPTCILTNPLSNPKYRPQFAINVSSSGVSTLSLIIKFCLKTTVLSLDLNSLNQNNGVIDLGNLEKSQIKTYLNDIDGKALVELTEDLPMSDSKVKGSLIGETNQHGTLSHSAAILKPPPVTNLEESLKVDASSLQVSGQSTTYNVNLTGSVVVVLSDVSGSMALEGQMERLKKSLFQILETYKTNHISLASWETETLVSCWQKYLKLSMGLRKTLNRLIVEAKSSTTVGAKPTKPLFHPYHPDVQIILSKPGIQPIIAQLDHQGQIDLTDLPDGTYTAQLLQYNEPEFIDLGARLMNFNFSLKDLPMSDSKVEGSLIVDGTRDEIKLNTTSDQKGDYSVVLPPSKINLQVTNQHGTLSHSAVVLKPPPVATLEESLKVDPSSLQLSEQSTTYNVKLTGSVVVVLSDVSGSMALEGQMGRLKKSLFQILETYKTKNISLASWDTETYWCLNGKNIQASQNQILFCGHWRRV